MTIDFGKLVNALTNNGHSHVPPQDVIRLGIVVGYDPGWDSTSKKHSYPFLSVTLAGDTNPMHGLRFAETYVPNIGDTVWIMLSGEDGWVMGALAGSSKEVIGQLRSPVSLLRGSSFTDTTVIPSSGAVTTLSSTDQNAPYLPNRIYRLEAVCTFTVSGVAQVAGTVGVSATGTASNNTYGTTGGGSITPLTVTATNSGGSVGFSTADPWSTSQIMSFKGDISAGADTTITYVGTNQGAGKGRGNTDITDIQALQALSPSGKVYITHIDGTRVPQGTYVSGTSTAGTGTVTLSQACTTGSAALTYTTFLCIAQNTPTIAYTWPAITADVGGSITWPAITTTSSGTGSFTNSTQNSEVSIGVISPDGYQEMTRYDVTGAKDGQQFTISASTTYWKIPTAAVAPNSWTPNFNWNIAMQSIGTVKPTITNISQKFLVYDCGVAS